jgi:hypothetical protein
MFLKGIYVHPFVKSYWLNCSAWKLVPIVLSIRKTLWWKCNSWASGQVIEYIYESHLGVFVKPSLCMRDYSVFPLKFRSAASSIWTWISFYKVDNLAIWCSSFREGRLKRSWNLNNCCRKATWKYFFPERFFVPKGPFIWIYTELNNKFV